MKNADIEALGKLAVMGAGLFLCIEVTRARKVSPVARLVAKDFENDLFEDVSEDFVDSLL